MSDNVIEEFAKILKEDIVVLKEILEEKDIKFKEKDTIYVIDFNLFVGLTKQYCFKNETRIEHVFFPSETEEISIPITVVPIPDNRSIFFKSIFLKDFDEKRILSLSYVYGSHSETNYTEYLYYRFFYALCKRVFKNPNNIENIIRDLLDQWNRALEQEIMEVYVFLPLDTVSIVGKGVTLNIEEKFQMKKVNLVIIKNLSEGVNQVPPLYTIISSKMDLSTKIYTSDNSGDPSIEQDIPEYTVQYQEAIKDLHILVNTLYLNDFFFKWRSPIIHLPWWFNSELFDYRKFERKYHPVDKYIKQEDFSRISNTYSALKCSNLIDKDDIILNSYFRLIQHHRIDAYFIIDASTFLESVFTKGGNKFVGRRLRLNASSLLAKNEEDFDRIDKFMKNFYEIRSTMVHGDEWQKKLKKFIDKRYGLDGATENLHFRFHDELINYLNSALRYLVEIMIKDSTLLDKIKSDRLFFFNSSKFIKGEVRKKILQKIKKSSITPNKFQNLWEEFCSFCKLNEQDL